MAGRKGALTNAIAHGQSRAPKPKTTKAKVTKPGGVRSIVPLDQILDRPHGDTRPLNIDHVAELAESIAAVGLIQPIAVDSAGHLLAGGHRRDAIRLLGELANDPELEEKERYAAALKQHFSQGVPVRRFDFNAADDPEQAIAIEAAENEKRRDYTKEEVKALADQLIKAGYVDRQGPIKQGQKRLKPALALVIGKSQKTVSRYLKKDAQKGHVSVLSAEEKRAKLLEKWAKDYDSETAEAMRGLAERLRSAE